MSWIELFFSFDGRINRKTYWLATLVPALVQFAASVAGHNTTQNLPFFAAVSLVTIASVVALTAKRLHDLGKSGWWQLVWIAALPLLAAAYFSAVYGQNSLAMALGLVATATSAWGWWIAIQIMFFNGEPEANGFSTPPGRDGRPRPASSAAGLSRHPQSA